MFEAFVATFFEGLEAFLLVAVALAYFRKTRRGVAPAVQLGVGLSAVASLMAAWLLSSADNPERWIWNLAIAAAVLISLLAVDVWRAWRRLVHAPHEPVEEADPTPRGFVWLAVLLGSILLVSRSGMSTVLLFGSLIFQVGAVEVTTAAVGGTVTAALVSWLWSRYARHLPSRIVIIVTAAAVLIFLVHLVISDILGLWQNRLWPLL